MMNNLVNRTQWFDDFFKDTSPGYFVRPLHGDSLSNPEKIRIDVKDTGPNYVVVADVPGVKKEDIHVHIENGTVTLKAEVQQQDEHSEQGKVVHSERYYGSIVRSFTLSSDIDETNATAKYENGVLTLTLPKASATKSKRITVE
jgi:HSP20 family protein